MMPRIIWITIGLFTGFFARTFFGSRSPKTWFDIGLAIVGALIGGWFFGFVDYTSAAGFPELGERDILIDVIGSATLFIIFQTLTRSAE